MYNAYALNERLMRAFQARDPNFRALRMIFSSEPGGGKSTVLASVPVAAGKQRLIFDNEDSMAYLDGGKDGVDVYTPRRQQFAMIRMVMPSLWDYARYFRALKADPEGRIGAVGIDNLSMLQDLIKQTLVQEASNPAQLLELFKAFDAATALPNLGLVRKWASASQPGPEFWATAKVIPQQIMLTCMKLGIHLVMSTEQGNVWEGYGTDKAKVVGKKAKIWDVWYRYTDLVVSLKRDLNSTHPPRGMLFINQPKNRLQGLNPSWQMAWEGFIGELEEASERTSVDIPEEAKVVYQEQVEDPV